MNDVLSLPDGAITEDGAVRINITAGDDEGNDMAVSEKPVGLPEVQPASDVAPSLPVAPAPAVPLSPEDDPVAMAAKALGVSDEPDAILPESFAEVLDVPVQALQGPVDAAEDTLKFFVDVAEYAGYGVNSLVGDDKTALTIEKIADGAEAYISKAFEHVDFAGEPKSGLAGGARAVSEFTTAFASLAAGNVGGVLSKVPKAGNLAKDLFQGGAASAVVFSEAEERAATVAKEFGFENELINWLAGDDDDGDMERRLKSAVDDIFTGAVLAPVAKGLMSTFKYVKVKQAFNSVRETLRNTSSVRNAEMDKSLNAIRSVSAEPLVVGPAKDAVKNVRPNKKTISDDELRMAARLQGFDADKVDFNAYRKEIAGAGMEERAITLVDNLAKVGDNASKAVDDYIQRDAAGDAGAVDEFFDREGRKFFEAHGAAKDAMSPVGRSLGVFSRSQSTKDFNVIFDEIKKGNVEDKRALMHTMKAVFSKQKQDQMAEAMANLEMGNISRGQVGKVLREVYQGFLMTPSGVIADAVTKPLYPVIDIVDGTLGHILGAGADAVKSKNIKPFLQGKTIDLSPVHEELRSFGEGIVGAFQYMGNVKKVADLDFSISGMKRYANTALSHAGSDPKDFRIRMNGDEAGTRFDQDFRGAAVSRETFGLRTKEAYEAAAAESTLDALPQGPGFFEDFFAKGINAFGRAVRFSQRGQILLDDVSRPGLYNVRLSKLAARQARQEGLAYGSPEYVKRLEELKVAPPADLIMAKDDPFEALSAMMKDDDLMLRTSIHAQAKNWSEVVTFTDPPGRLLKAATEMVDAFPGAFIILPFMKTMAKMASMSLQYTPPIALFTPRMQKDLMAGGLRREEALGRLAAGSMAVYGGYHLANSGVITGDGPQDPKERQALEDAGWRANSVRVGESYIPIERFGPVVFPFLFGAKIHNLMADRSDPERGMDEQEGSLIVQALGKGVVGSADILMNQYQMQNMSDLLHAITTNNEDKVKEFVQKQAAVFASPGFVRDVAGYVQGDDPIQEAQSFLDNVRRNWGQGTSLGPRLNKFGENLKRDERPFMFSPVSVSRKPSKLDLDLQEEGVVLMKPTDRIDGVKLDKAEYRRMLEIMKDNGVKQSVKDTLATVKGALPNVAEVSVMGEKVVDTVQDVVRGTYNEHVDAARQQLLQENDDLRHRVERREYLRATQSGLNNLMKINLGAQGRQMAPINNLGLVPEQQQQ